MVKGNIDKTGVDDTSKKPKDKDKSNGLSRGVATATSANATSTKSRAPSSAGHPPKSAVADNKKLRADVSILTKSVDKLAQEVGKLKSQPPPPPPTAPLPPNGGDYFSSAYYYHDDPYGYPIAEDYYDDDYGEQDDVPYVEHDLEVRSSAGSDVNNIVSDAGTSIDNASEKQDKDTDTGTGTGHAGRGMRRGQGDYHGYYHYGYQPYPQQRGSFGPMRRGFPRSRHADYGPYPANRSRGPMRGRASRSRGSSASKGEVSLKLSHEANETVHKVTASHNEPFQAGRLKNFVEQWQLITSDEEILQTVMGCTIEFSEAPLVQTSKPRSKFNATQSVIVKNEIEKLIEKQVLEIVEPEIDENISTIFLRPKKKGTYRMILNLKPFNKNVEYFHFKMETFDMAIKLLYENCYLASIDLKDAYYSVPIHEDFRKYLRFIWEDKTFQYAALPNGLSCGPRKFTKLMKPVYATLRRLGINVSGFLDDLLIVGHSVDELKVSVETVVHTLQNLGFVINFEKSILEPCSRLRHLGFIIDSVTMTVSLPQDKIDTVKELCSNMLEKSEETIRNVSSS